jgi:hypothetical protein
MAIIIARMEEEAKQPAERPMSKAEYLDWARDVVKIKQASAFRKWGPKLAHHDPEVGRIFGEIGERVDALEKHLSRRLGDRLSTPPDGK